MDKYSLLVILNIPFVIFGVINTLLMYREKTIQKLSTITRLIFWGFILIGLIFAQELYSLLLEKGLTDTTPLSLADVILVTGVVLTLSLCISLYSKVELLEKRISDLHEELSIRLSIK